MFNLSKFFRVFDMHTLLFKANKLFENELNWLAGQ
jgi:hypothetical protein